MTETEGEQGKEMQLKEFAACFNLVLKPFFYETQYVAAGVDSVAHRHKLVCVGNTEKYTAVETVKPSLSR